MDETALNIYTDGSSYSNPRKGGTGFRFVTIDELGNEVGEDFVGIGYSGATNNQMELQACINALKEVIRRGDLSKFSKVIIYTDSDYIVSNYQTAKFQWSQNQWRKSSDAPVLNAEQWKELVKCTMKIYKNFWKKVEIKWVKGHSKDQHNKAVDKLAKQAAKIKTLNKVSVVKVRRKKFAQQKVVPGSVKMLGQQISIYIVTDEYLKLQRTNKYKYQVESKGSPFYKNTDFIFSNISLRAGHSYKVRFNDDMKYPQIVKLFKEIKKKSDDNLSP